MHHNTLTEYSCTAIKHDFSELMYCFDKDLGNNFENTAWNLEHNAEKLQEILNKIMQGIMSIITLALNGNIALNLKWLFSLVSKWYNSFK